MTRGARGVGSAGAASGQPVVGMPWSRRGRGWAAALALVLSACAATGPRDAPAPLTFDTSPTSCTEQAAADARLDRPIAISAIDGALIDRAIRLYTNEARCEAGMAPLDPDQRLAEAARIHVTDMASAGFVAATRPADPTKTLGQRYRLAGVGPYSQRGENLMRISLETPGVARVASRATECDFAAAAGLVPTYRTVARRLVDAWTRTQALSANLLAPDWTHMGAAIAIRPVEGTCGDVYAAQSFKAL